ncbi:hypothetical protein WUBG_13716 [Wuchereria bancrofti]|uniref:Uncharacterized protein n=1 Tax=Wuchereria bancrofti TaxID=6293 RepID=J9DZT2_WUCBA|nr:hypothetical protein WUBG_13716 [Wuchereria bancrofti]
MFLIFGYLTTRQSSFELKFRVVLRGILFSENSKSLMFNQIYLNSALNSNAGTSPTIGKCNQPADRLTFLSISADGNLDTPKYRCIATFEFSEQLAKSDSGYRNS